MLYADADLKWAHFEIRASVNVIRDHKEVTYNSQTVQGKRGKRLHLLASVQ